MAVSYLLDITGVPGESKDDNSSYNQKIEIEGWGFGSHQTGVIQAGTGRAGGKVEVSDFSFSKHADTSSPKLMQACATGEHIQKAILTCRRSGITGGGLSPYYVVQFDDLIISSFNTSGGNGDSGLPAEQISFNFARIQAQYTPQDQGKSQGTLQAGYNLKTSQST